MKRHYTRSYKIFTSVLVCVFAALTIFHIILGAFFDGGEISWIWAGIYTALGVTILNDQDIRKIMDRVTDLEEKKMQSKREDIDSNGPPM